MPNSGLVFITKTSFSAVSSVNIDNCFSATYVHYLITRSIAGSIDAQALMGQLRVSGTDTTTNYRRQQVNASSTTLTGERAVSQTSFSAALGRTETTATGYGELFVFNPQEAVYTGAWSNGGFATSGNLELNYRAHSQDTTASGFTGITIFPVTGTITGSISVFGWAKS